MRLLGQQRFERATHGTACAQQQDAFVFEGLAMIDLEIAYQPRAISIVPQQRAIGLKHQGIHRTRATSAFG